MSFILYLTNAIGPTSVGVNTFSTIVLLTPITNCDGGAPLATQHTHFRLILCLILCGGPVALVSPNMRRDMLPWFVGGVTDLPADAKLCKMQLKGPRDNVDSKIVPVSSIAPEGWGQKRAEMLCHPYILGGPMDRTLTPKSKGPSSKFSIAF